MRHEHSVSHAAERNWAALTHRGSTTRSIFTILSIERQRGAGSAVGGAEPRTGLAMTAAAVDLSDFALWRNGFPDELFAELRRTRPLFRHDLTPGVAKTVQRDFWVTTKHRHAVRLHRDVESFTAVDGPLIQPVDMFSSYPTIINMDPPGLNKRRKLISNAFNPRAIAKLEDGIRARAARMIDDLLAEGGGDWIEDVADALPMTVIGDIIGIPEEDRPRIFDSLDRILKANSPEARPSRQDYTDLYATIFGYAMELTAEKRRNPADDIWSTLASAVITGEDGEEFSLPANELEFFFFVLAFAGSDTTKNALAIGLQAFVANPEQIERYREQEELRPSAVEEVLRWASPVAYWTRTAKVDVEMDGQHIPAGRPGGVDAAFGQPRRGGLRVAVHLRHRPTAQPARGIRRRRPTPLPGRHAGARRTARGVRRTAAAMR